jgi:hypothetical protein
VIAFASPLTYSNDLIRYGLGGSSYIGLMVDTALLISFGALFLAAGMKFHDRFRQ